MALYLAYRIIVVVILRRSEAATGFWRVKESKDHVTVVARIRVQGCDPVVVASRVRITPQVSKILHRYKGSNEKMAVNGVAFNHISQHLRTGHLTSIKRR